MVIDLKENGASYSSVSVITNNIYTYSSVATVESFKNKIVDHTTAEQGMCHVIHMRYCMPSLNSTFIFKKKYYDL